MRIGYHKSLLLRSSFDTISEGLKDNNLDIELVESPFDFEESSDVILQEKMDAFIYPLHLIPYERTNKTKIWALCKRKSPNNVFLVRKDIAKRTERIPVRENEHVTVTSDFLSQIFLEIRLDLKFMQVDDKSFLEKLHRHDLNAAIAPQLLLSEEILSGYLSLILNEREFGHAPGQGAHAIISTRDSIYGPQLRGLHHQETAFACNIERKIDLALEMKVNLHVEIDQDGSYHIWLNHFQDEKLKKYISRNLLVLEL